MRSPWILIAFVSCARSEAPRHDDASVLEGEYERARTDLIGEVEVEWLFVTKEGMTIEREPFRQSLVFDEVACSSPTSCKVKGVLCGAKLDKQADGRLSVEVDMRCESMGGLWYTPNDDVAEPAVSAAPSASTPREASSASDDDEEDFPTAPAASSGCLRVCNDTAMTCSRACKGSVDSCLADCNRKGMTCANRCTTL